MLRLDHIHSLTEFQRNARQHIRRIRKTGQPIVLTVNGEADVVVQDAHAYQELLDSVENARLETVLQDRMATFDEKSAFTIEQVAADLRKLLAQRNKEQ